MTADLPEVVRAMLRPEIYPEKPSHVEMEQTQMSFVFLAGKYAYKIKKPVNLGYLDYTTLEKRHFFCEQEIKLNRRLCREAYLEVVPLTGDKGGIALAGSGEILEYAVKMLRLPRDRMMPFLLERDEFLPEMVTELAGKLAEFHTAAETNPVIRSFGSLETIRINTDENFYQTESYIGRTINLRQYRLIKDYTQRFLQDYSMLFRGRVESDRIRDCHGDLHAQHICFNNGICIFDCIEFNDRFRYSDVASDIAFLAMDLDHFGRADISRRLSREYAEKSRDRRLKDLLKFYKCYRAYIRGKVGSFKYDDPYITAEEREQVLEDARSYFELAEAYSRQRPILFITVGLVGSGKTTLSRALARRLGAIVISSDVIRKQLASIPVAEHRFEEMESGIYSADFSRLTYDKLMSEAREILLEGDPVILDASFIRREDRLKAKTLAEETGADFFMLECALDEASTRQRLSRRLQEVSISDGRWEIYQQQRKKFEPVNEAPSGRHFIIDTSQPLAGQISRIVEGT